VKPNWLQEVCDAKSSQVSYDNLSIIVQRGVLTRPFAGVTGDKTALKGAVISREDDFDRFDKNSGFHHQRPALNIGEVQTYAPAHFVEGFCWAARAIALREACDPRLCPKTITIVWQKRSVIMIVGNRMWAWPNNRHVANQDVPQLRQLIQTGAT
jgi:hypothetical protein